MRIDPAEETPQGGEQTDPAPARTLTIGLTDLDRTAAEFVAVAEAIERGETPAPIERLSFADVPMLLETLTPQRWRLLEHLKKTGPLSVNALARQLGRNYKNVHSDVGRLLEVGLVERQEDDRLVVPYETIIAELKIAA